MKINLIILTSVFCIAVSCSVLKTERNDIAGTFYKKGSKNKFNYEYGLKISSDGSFLLSYKVHGANAQCDGIWKQSNDTLFLNCNEEKDIALMLSSGYMNKREYVLKIINRDKLRLDDIVLKRIE
ncbi:MAG: hypothetical protein Q8K02_11995 [Flavobacterium sp.]|nr:hypothetical protein [Flavobacterium sp.]